MQRILFILALAVALFFTADKAYAQRDLPGQTGVQFTTGGVDRFLSWKSGGERHYFTSLAFTRTNRNRTYWLYGLDYQIKEYTYESKAIPKAQFTGEVGYFVPFFSDRGKNVFFSAGLSGLAGYETTNWNDKLLYDGATLKNDGCFIYGFAPAFEMEAFLSDRLVLLFNVRQRIFFGSSVGHFHTIVSIGVKYIFN